MVVDRNRRNRNDVLLSEALCTYPPEDKAAKIFYEFCKNNPEYSLKEIHLRIDEEEEEEDHYGNGGRIRRTVAIYKTRAETDEEFRDRVLREEEEVLSEYYKQIINLIRKLEHDLDLGSSSREYKEKIVRSICRTLEIRMLREGT